MISVFKDIIKIIPLQDLIVHTHFQKRYGDKRLMIENLKQCNEDVKLNTRIKRGVFWNNVGISFTWTSVASLIVFFMYHALNFYNKCVPDFPDVTDNNKGILFFHNFLNLQH